MMKEPEQDKDMDAELRNWGRQVEREAVPDRLLDLAFQLRQALVQARSAPPRRS
ncbi:hypothetical protein [Paracoccus sp. SSK6]|uniref:hypothetical protein n=1 Tax=Paracoccus sp. SSK6 TaxID=3143131 RepID=UPI00321A4BD5